MSTLKTINLRGKTYTEVNERVRYFRSAPEFEGWSLTTEILSMEGPNVIIKATIADAEGRVRATGIAHEVAGSSNVNKTSFVENGETSAWGRALGNLGIGIQGGSVATYDEVKRATQQQEGSLLDITDDLAKRMESAIKKGKGDAVAGTLHRYKDSPNMKKIVNLLKSK